MTHFYNFNINFLKLQFLTKLLNFRKFNITFFLYILMNWSEPGTFNFRKKSTISGLRERRRDSISWHQERKHMKRKSRKLKNSRFSHTGAAPFSLSKYWGPIPTWYSRGDFISHIVILFHNFVFFLTYFFHLNMLLGYNRNLKKIKTWPKWL